MARNRIRSTGKARLFLCRACGKAFSSRVGTACFGLRTPKRRVLLRLRLLDELWAFVKTNTQIPLGR